ncbi:MAG: acyl-ACP desaturase, partial [Actinomycetes bacterium]
MTATANSTPASLTSTPRNNAIDAEAAAKFSDVDILRELEPLVAGEVNRHISMHKDWRPHEYVPWTEGENFDGVLNGKAWSSEQSSFPDEVRTALVVNLLTEDNLPSYHHEIATIFRGEGAWGTWVHRWTAEEGRHSVAMRDYLMVTRSVDPDELETSRMTHMSTGFKNSHEDQLLHGVAYVAFQEL